MSVGEGVKQLPSRCRAIKLTSDWNPLRSFSFPSRGARRALERAESAEDPFKAVWPQIQETRKGAAICGSQCSLEDWDADLSPSKLVTTHISAERSLAVSCNFATTLLPACILVLWYDRYLRKLLWNILHKLRISREILCKSLSSWRFWSCKNPSKIVTNNSQGVIFLPISCQRITSRRPLKLITLYVVLGGCSFMIAYQTSMASWQVAWGHQLRCGVKLRRSYPQDRPNWKSRRATACCSDRR